MPESNLQNKTIFGMLWASIGKLGTMGLQFLSNLVLARLLLPEDFGTIGMLQIFIAISSVFVTAGFGAALIQKKETTHIDYTSVFYFNLFASIVIYLTLFILSPIVAEFYNMSELCIILRVQGISLIIQAFATVQSNILQKQLRFKELAIRNIIATITGTIVAVFMAFCGFGFWSLVTSNLVSTFASVLLLWKMSSWRPTWNFSLRSLKKLFAFGGLMALSSFVETVYSEIQGLIIGKFYSASDLGYYTQAKKLEMVPSAAINSVINQVSFPVFSKLQDEKTKLQYGLSKSVKYGAYISFSVMILLIIIADSIIPLLYGERWGESIPYFRLLCLGGLMSTINCINTNTVMSLGKGKVYFVLQLSKRIIGIGMIIYGMRYGIIGMIIGVISIYYIAFIMNGIVLGKLVGYNLIKQLKDILPSVLLFGMIGVSVYYFSNIFFDGLYVAMIVRIILYISLSIILSKLFKFEQYALFNKVLKENVSKIISKIYKRN